MPDNQQPPIALPVAAITFFRLVVNTARRFAYPFAPAISRGLGVSLTAVTSLIAVNQFTSLLALLVGPLADRWGYRKMMVAGLAILAVGMLAAALFPIYAVVLVAFFLAGLGKSILDPAMQAWAGQRVPYHRRALVIGILETSWATSSLIGIPLVGILIKQFGWQSPFLAMGVLALVGSLVLFLVIPREEPLSPRPGNAEGSAFAKAYRIMVANPTARGTLGYAFFVCVANDNLFVVYGAWLEQQFGLGLVALGVGTGLIGIAELLGEGLTATLADRIGIQRSLVWGLVLTSAAYFILPFMDHSLAVALVGLAFVFLAFEFTMVTSFSMATEILPHFRATMMASFMAMAGLGRVVGALAGGWIWQAGGMLAIGWISGALTAIGLVSLLYGIKRMKPS